MGLKQKLSSWVKRYLPSEIVGTATALSFATVANQYSTNGVVIAYVGTIGESIGFYSTVFIQQVLEIIRIRKLQNRTVKYQDFFKVLTSIIIEFGPAGLIDSLLIRPFLLFIFPILLNNFTLGILLGKIVGDVCFYGLAIMSYEFKRKTNYKL